jgi:hypothetical protein
MKHLHVLLKLCVHDPRAAVFGADGLLLMQVSTRSPISSRRSRTTKCDVIRDNQDIITALVFQLRYKDLCTFAFHSLCSCYIIRALPVLGNTVL